MTTLEPTRRSAKPLLATALLAALAAALTLSGCSSIDSTPSAVGDPGTEVAAAATETTADGDDADSAEQSDDTTSENQASHFEPSDLDHDPSTVVDIALDGTSASVDSDAVTIEGSTITITAEGTYALGGSLTDGSVIVDVADTDDVMLILDGVDITNTDGAAIAVMSADDVIVLLADGATNSLTDGADDVFPDAETDEPNATLYSATDLTIAGEGELIVDANHNDGIASKDGLVIASGTIAVAAVDDGVRGKDYVIVEGGSLTVQAGGDGIKADNTEDADRGYVLVSDGTIDIAAGDDGIQAATDILVTGGQLVIDAGSVSGTGRAIQADVLVGISGGVIDAIAVDDTIHSNDQVTVDGGTITLAAGDDGVHGDYLVTVDGGSITITEAFEGIESEVIVVNDGDIDITSSDDGLNVASAEAAPATAAAPTGRGAGRPGGGGGPGGDAEVGDHVIFINGGTIVITVSGELAEQGDGIDANGHVEMTGGVVAISGPTDTRNSAIDYSGGTFVMTGGTFIGTNIDGRNSEGIGTGSTQASMYLTSGSTIEAGTVVHIETADGQGLVTFEPVNDYSVIVFSSPDLVDGESYDVYLGGTVSGNSATGLYDDAAHTAGDLAATVAAEALG